LATALLCAVLACAGKQTGAEEIPVSELSPMPILMPMIEPGGSDPLPEAWAEAAELFARAEVRCDEEAYADAAELFLGAARALLGAEEGGYGPSVLAARRSAYHNAWECYVATGDEASGARALEQAAQADPTLADDIAAITTTR